MPSQGAPVDRDPAENDHSRQEQCRPLEVVIIGAGISGLSLAIFLRQNGHRVKIFEQSSFAKELGAAVHIPPNAHGLVKKMGVDPAATGANEVEHIAEYTANGEVVREVDLTKANKTVRWQHKWMLAHRVSLHEALKERALSTLDAGLPCELHLATSVIDVHPDVGGVTLQDGRIVSGDVVIGADGVHSRSRRRVPGGENAKPFNTGKNAFRFLLTREDALSDPLTRPLCEKPSMFSLFVGTDRRIIMYPTSNNKFLNFVCIHPESESEGRHDWSTDASKSSLLRVYKSFAPPVLGLLAKADPSSLKVWELLDMEDLPTWVGGYFALIGDAAHPFLPHQGQGGAVAMEDAAAIGVVLERGVKKEEVPERLRLYERIRTERARAIQEFTRQTGLDVPDHRLNTMAHRMYNFAHDEIDHSTQELRMWKYQTSKAAWTMPVAFGIANGRPISQQTQSRATFVTMTFKFETSRTLIRNLLPSGTKNFEFEGPGTIAVCSLVHTSIKGGEKVSNGDHSSLSLYIHNIKYTRANGSTISGTYVPAVFDNAVDVIVHDREVLGLPTVFTDDIHAEHSPEQYLIQAKWKDVTWATILLRNIQQSSPHHSTTNDSSTLSSSVGETTIISWRTMPIIPHEDRHQQTPQSESFPVSIALGAEAVTRVESEWTTTDATVKFDPYDWNTLPTLHETARRLAEIPIFELIAARVVSGTGNPHFARSIRLE